MLKARLNNLELYSFACINVTNTPAEICMILYKREKSFDGLNAIDRIFVTDGITPDVKLIGFPFNFCSRAASSFRPDAIAFTGLSTTRKYLSIRLQYRPKVKRYRLILEQEEAKLFSDEENIVRYRPKVVSDDT